MVRTVLAWIGSILLWIVLAPVFLIVLAVALPLFAAYNLIDDLVSLMRREPRYRLPETGAKLLPTADGPPSLDAVAEAIRSRCSTPVERVDLAGGAVELASAAAAGRAVLLRFSDDEVCEDEIVVEVGPWVIDSPEGMDFSEGDAAVAMAVAYLDHGVTYRAIGKRTYGLLRLDAPGLWWRPASEGAGTFRQTWFRDLPGRPATEAERAQHQARAAERKG